MTSGGIESPIYSHIILREIKVKNLVLADEDLAGLPVAL